MYERGGLLAHTLLVVLLSVSLMCFIEVQFRYRLPWMLRTLSVLFLIWTVYGIVIIMTGNGVDWVSNYFYLRNITCSLLPIFPFYLFSKKGCLTENGLKKWFFIFVAVSIVQFNAVNDEVLTELYGNGMVRDEMTNNIGYILLSLFPLLPLWNKKPLIQYLFWGICMLYILFSIKRGAILIGGVCSIWFFINTFKEKNSKGKQLWRFLLTIAIVVVSIHFIHDFFHASQYFAYRLESTLEGDSSGRGEIYKNYFAFFLQQTNMLRFLFGNGADATLRLFGQYAHNDWLEIGINNGVAVLFLYFIFWIQLFSNIRNSKSDNMCHMMLAMFFLIYFMKSLISMSYNDISVYSSCAFGFALAKMDNG